MVVRSTHYIRLRARDYKASLLECHSSVIADRLRTSEVETQALPAAAATPFMAQRCEDGRSAGVPVAMTRSVWPAGSNPCVSRQN